MKNLKKNVALRWISYQKPTAEKCSRKRDDRYSNANTRLPLVIINT